jgi:hypothetical protein
MMNRESAIQLTQQLLGKASNKQDSDPVDDEAWADLIEVGIWAQYHSPYPHLVQDAIPPYDVHRTWPLVRHAAQAIGESFTGKQNPNDISPFAQRVRSA